MSEDPTIDSSVDRPVKSDGVVQPYVTAFLDVLGFAQQVKDYDGLKDGMSRAEVTRLLLPPIQAITRARIVFETSLRPSLEHPGSRWPKEIRRQVEQLLDVRITGHGFSDCFVASCPFDVANRARGALAVYQLFIIAALSMRGCMLAEAPMRGGIEMGYATKLSWRGTDEIIGSSVAKAYELERDAGWPRIRIGPELRRDLWVQRETPERTPEDLLTAFSAKSCLALIIDEPDGSLSLDWMSPRLGWPDSGVGPGAEAAILDFACRQRRSMESAGNAKLSTRWARTVEYVEGAVRRRLTMERTNGGAPSH